MGRRFMLCHYKLKIHNAVTHVLHFTPMVIASQVLVVPIRYVIIYIQMKSEEKKDIFAVSVLNIEGCSTSFKEKN